jgi:hypothetical protein
MGKTDKIDMLAVMLEAGIKSYQTAFETAVRTGTSLVVNRNGKIVKIKPPYEYKLVRIKPSKKKKSSKK